MGGGNKGGGASLTDERWTLGDSERWTLGKFEIQRERTLGDFYIFEAWNRNGFRPPNVLYVNSYILKCKLLNVKFLSCFFNHDKFLFLLLHELANPSSSHSSLFLFGFDTSYSHSSLFYLSPAYICRLSVQAEDERNLEAFVFSRDFRFSITLKTIHHTCIQ
ncbi:hypothetical protein ACJX0J_023822 [Zea mays]